MSLITLPFFSGWRAEQAALAGQSDPLTPEQQRRLFKKYVCYIEIELFSFCNRRCWFCPNSSIDRHSENHFLPEELYLNLLQQLADLDFSGQISFSRYNEPLADKIILKRLCQARATLPKAFLHTNSNGDYLDAQYLQQLQEAGLDSLSVQNYSVEGKSREELETLMRARLAQLGLKPEQICTKSTFTWI